MKNDKSVTRLAIKDYDIAVTKKIENSIAKDSNGKPLIDVIFSPSDLIYDNAMKRGKSVHGLDGKSIRFPLLGIYRGSSLTYSNSNNAISGIKRNTYNTSYQDDKGNLKGVGYQVLLYSIPYQLDIYGQDEVMTLELLQELLFLLYRDPYVSLEKYNIDQVESTDDRVHRAEVIIDNSVIDNSALELEIDTGKIYRFTINFLLSDVLLTRSKGIYLIDTHDIDIQIVDDLKEK